MTSSQANDSPILFDEPNLQVMLPVAEVGGDSIAYGAEVEHQYRNSGAAEEVRFILIMDHNPGR